MTKLSIIVPIYNEESHLEASVKKLLSTTYPIEREFIFVNDGSTDKSGELLSQLAELFDFDLITMPNNQGKGAAIRQGLKKISGDLVMIQDADFEYGPNDVPAPITTNTRPSSRRCLRQSLQTQYPSSPPNLPLLC